MRPCDHATVAYTGNFSLTLTFLIILHFDITAYSGHDLACPSGHRCYGPQLHCQNQNLSSGPKYCGLSPIDAASKCAQSCSGSSGNSVTSLHGINNVHVDAECPTPGESCFNVDTKCEDRQMALERMNVPNPFNYFCGA